MLYETLLKKLKKRRASNLKGADGLTALEVSFSFSSGRNYLK
jgi:adenine nucleotide transporter 17